MGIPMILWAAIALVALIILLWFFPVTLWFQAVLSGVHIPLVQLVLMRWRGVNPNSIVIAMITGTKAGLSLKANELEAHYLAKGNVVKVVNALISADKANIPLDFKTAAGIDLAGRDVFEAVQMSVNPKVINTPPVTAVAKNGIQLICKARVTVRANINQLVGGAGEETVLARVGEGIVSSIGSAESHAEVLEKPESISKVVLAKGLDAGTAFEILSIDIADIDIGKNIGAVLQMDQADEGKGPGGPRKGYRGGSTGASGNGRGVPQWQSRCHGLLQNEEHPSRHRHARKHLQAVEEVPSGTTKKAHTRV